MIGAMENNETPAPVSHPTIVIDGKAVEVKFKLSMAKRLKKEYNIDLRVGVKEDNVAVLLDNMLAMLSIGISHSVKMSPDELADRFDYGDISLISEVISEAQKKVSGPESAAAYLRAEQLRKLQQNLTPTIH
jgi:hypothetical protein